MAHRISTREWASQLEILDRRQQADRDAAQRTFRLFQCLEKRDQKAIDTLLSRGLALDAALTCEVEGGPPGADRFLASMPFTPTPPSVPPLAWLAAHDDLEQVEMLLRHGAAATVPFANGYDAAWAAMRADAHTVFVCLMDAGANPNLRLHDGSGRTRLMDAVTSRAVAVVSTLLNRHANAADYDASGQTALHLNLRQDPYDENDREITRILLEASDVLEFDDNTGVTPLDLMTSPQHQALLNVQRLKNRPPPVVPPTPSPEPSVPGQPAPTPPSPSGPRHRRRA